MSDNEIKIKASVEDTASPEIKKIGKNISDMGKSGTQTAKDIDKTAEALDNTTKKTKGFVELFSRARRSCTTFSFALADTVLSLGRLSYAYAKESITDAIKGFAAQEMAANRLTSALKNQGIYSSYLADDLDRYAKSLRSISGIDDDVIKDNMRLLVNYGLIGDELKRATKAGLTLSSALGMDLNSSMLAVAKAAEGNFQMFSRWGIKIDETASQSEKFTQLLSQIEKKYGDIVNINADNIITQTNLLREQWGDFKEELASGVVPLLNKVLNLFNDRFTAKETLNNLSDIELNYLDKEIELQNQLIKQQEDLNTLKKYAPGATEKIAESEALIEATKREISLNDQKMQGLLESRKIEREANEARIAEAQKNIAAEKTAEEERQKAQKKKEEDLKKAEDLEKRKADMIISSTESVLQKVADLNNSYTSYEYAEKVNKYKLDYETKISFLNEEIKAIKDKYGEESQQYRLLVEKKKSLEAEFSEFNDKETNTRTEKAGFFYELDVWLSQESIKKKIDGIRNLSQIQTSSIRAVAAVGKAAAIATATIDTYKSANEAYAAMAGIPVVGPYLAGIAAAAAVVAGLENVANIAGVQLAVGTGYVPKDMQATIHEGEMVVPRTFSEAIRSGDISLSGGNVDNSSANNSSISVVVQVSGDIIGDTSTNLAKNIQARISKMIATGQTKPFPVKERM